jgi:hypothetical protein
MMGDPLLEAARALGVSKGTAVAKLVVDKDTSVSKAQLLVDGYLYSDEEVMAICPQPLSGEYADSDSTMRIMEDIAGMAGSEELLKKQNFEEAMDASSDVLDTFESGYQEGFWAEVLKRANSILELNNSE